MARPAHDYARVDKFVPDTRRAETANPYPPVLIVITLIATLGIIRYGMFLLAPGNRGNLLPYLMVVTAELILIVHALLSGWTILTGTKGPRDFPYHETKSGMFDRKAIKAAGLKNSPHLWPILMKGREIAVDVFIPVYGEDVDVIRRTAVAALAIKGKHRTWILDDGRSDAVKAMADEIGANYIRRLSGGGAKAGNINHALAVAKGEFFCVFDADFVPRPEFLVETVPFFVDSTVAFVQTPQVYGNLNNLISRGAGYMQTVFYKFVQSGRNHFNAAFCVGTNVIYRRAAVDDVGGIYTDSKSEDVWTSLMLHERGWRTIYIPQTLAVGDAPDTIEAYTKQQLRWATGGFEIMLTHNPLSPRHKLSMDQRLMYLVTATHYLTGIAPGLLLLVPPAGDLLRPAPGEPGHLRDDLGDLLRRLLHHADPPGLLHPRLVPLRGAAAGRGVVPDLPGRPGQRLHRQGAEVARHRRQRQGAEPVQLHHPAGADVLLPAAHLGGLHLA